MWPKDCRICGCLVAYTGGSRHLVYHFERVDFDPDTADMDWCPIDGSEIWRKQHDPSGDNTDNKVSWACGHELRWTTEPFS